MCLVFRHEDDICRLEVVVHDDIMPWTHGHELPEIDYGEKVPSIF